jgi:hypothetical protein
MMQWHSQALDAGAQEEQKRLFYASQAVTELPKLLTV